MKKYITSLGGQLDYIQWMLHETASILLKEFIDKIASKKLDLEALRHSFKLQIADTNEVYNNYAIVKGLRCVNGILWLIVAGDEDDEIYGTYRTISTSDLTPSQQLVFLREMHHILVMYYDELLVD